MLRIFQRSVADGAFALVLGNVQVESALVVGGIGRRARTVPADLRVTIFADIVLRHDPAPYSRIKTRALMALVAGFRLLEDGRRLRRPICSEPTCEKAFCVEQTRLGW
jgi:hypothetical protein